MTADDQRKLARRIDVSCVRTPHCRNDIVDLARASRDRGYVNAHVLPHWVPELAELLIGSETLVGAPVGFPSGGSTRASKLFEARALVESGVGELDVVINVARLRSGDHDYVRDELREVIAAVEQRVPVKVILEVHHLDDEQIIVGTELAVAAGASMLKTATGWAPPATTVECVRLIAGRVGADVGVKAAGGIRSLQDLRELEAAGATRFGISLPAAERILAEAADQVGAA